MWLLLKKNARLQFQAKLQGNPRKGKVSKRAKDVDVQYNSRPPPPPHIIKSDNEENLDSSCSVV